MPYARLLDLPPTFVVVNRVVQFDPGLRQRPSVLVSSVGCRHSYEFFEYVLLTDSRTWMSLFLTPAQGRVGLDIACE